MTADAKPVFAIPGTRNATPELPGILRQTTRGGDAGANPFVNPRSVRAKAVFDLVRPARGVAPTRVDTTLEPDDIVALEAQDGTTLFMRADRLRAEAALRLPEAIAADGSLLIDALRPRDAVGRGVGDWLWSRVSVLELLPDDIVEAARKKAIEWLGDKAQGMLLDWASLAATRLGTRALMWAIENRLPQGPGLYRWEDGGQNGLTPATPAQLAATGDLPVLLFIHGTASSTAGSFSDLGKNGADWKELQRHFGEHIYAFEHRSFSESPVDNALALAEALPQGARLHIVTHSRGGLVGDLLCLGGLSDALVAGWQRPAHAGARDGTDDLAQLVEEEKSKLRSLRKLLEERNFRIERYVRVACPARGTRLVGGNFDVFMSGLLSLIGLVPALAGSPLYAAMKRIVLEIAHQRTDPAWVPGIEAMLPNAPLAHLLAQAERKQGIRMAVVAGDIEGSGLLKQLAVMFTDWMFFDKVDNDLVVDTASMYAGLANKPGTRYLFQQGPEINHFRYFANAASRRAVQDWLLREDTDKLTAFEPLPSDWQANEEAARGRSTGTRAPTGSRPIVFVLPGIMGSHLTLTGTGATQERVWFDPLNLASGGLGKLAWQAQTSGREIVADDLFQWFYGECCAHLEQTHEVRPFPYDWRLPIELEAERLAQAIEAALTAAKTQPIRLLAHSMGGLVVRAMIALRPDLWQKIVDSGGRLVMLGTPNNGSHLIVETLLGKGDTVRKLAMLDQSRKLQAVLDIVAGFRGALQLLPRPDNFADTGESAATDYFKADIWSGYKARIEDWWFGDKVAALPDAAALDAAKKLWDETLKNNRAPAPANRVAYVFGVAAKTPCGLADDDGKLRLVGTPLGDGSVTWRSGRLEGLKDRCWYMPVAHGDLLATPEHFDAIAELLTQGETRLLERTPPATRAADIPETFRYDAGPTAIPTPEELAGGLMGPRALKPRRRANVMTLKVEVLAQDLRFARSAVVCGHYLSDPISGAEDQLDRHVVKGALRQRERLGQYAGKIGTATLVMCAQGEEQMRRGSQRGALVLGLGDYGGLTAAGITDSVRAGALHFLVHHQGQVGQTAGDAALELELSPLLIGFNSTANLSIEDSLEAMILGVAEANRRFESSAGGKLRIGKLQFTELYLDTAISATRALDAVRARLLRPLERLQVRLEIADELGVGDGHRPRLQSAASADGHWTRLLVTDADAADVDCAPECYEVRTVSSMPADKCRELLEKELPPADGSGKRRPCPELPPPKLAQRLKFVLLSARARAEQVFQQRQPGLIEAIVRESVGSSTFYPDHCRSLFHLMVPLDFKNAAAGIERLLLVVDGYTANLPWEMLVANEHPLVTKTAVVRQLATCRYRVGYRTTTEKTAFVVGNPSTDGFYRMFPDLARDDETRARNKLALLDGAEKEADAVAASLQRRFFHVEPAIGQESGALDVIGKLYRQPYRIIHIAAHGVFGAQDKDCLPRTGIVLSNGLLLTAAEIGQLEIVPDLVFLNCCHLGTADNLPRNGHRIAYSLARELIEMGVRCVVVAGWAVNDNAARLFAETFYAAMLERNEAFGAAITLARRTIYEQMPACNTWGAYQAYGDPMFRFDPPAEDDGHGNGWKPVVPDELIDALQRLITEIAAANGASPQEIAKRAQRLIDRAPPQWRDRPDVQYTLGRLYGDLGPDWFAQAIEAYRQAVSNGDEHLSAPIKAIEQMANFEVRLGIARNDKLLIETGLKRFEALIDSPAIPSLNPERWALLGSAYKRLAAAEMDDKKKWGIVAPLLTRSRDAYAHVEGGSDGKPINPYHAINRLQLDAILGTFADKADQAKARAFAQAAAAEARLRFKRDGKFFDAISPVDAEVAIKLIDGTLHKSVAKITRAYQDVKKDVPGNERQFDSVTKQLELMARFLLLRGGKDAIATALKTIASKLKS